MSKLFFMGFIQVFFVYGQTWFIIRECDIGILVFAFMISLVWSLNVRKMAFGGWKERFVYSTGATLGGYSGYLLSKCLVG